MSDLRNFTLMLAGHACLGERHHLPLVKVDWYVDRPRDVCRVGAPGSRRGVKPGNAGKTYPATPPSPDEVKAILAELWRPGLNRKLDALGRRNRALVVLLWRSGLRIHEALLLVPADLDFDRCVVTVQRGKGGKRRLSGIDRAALDEVREWMDVREDRGFKPFQPLFPVLEGNTKGGPLNQAYVRTKLHEAAARAGVTKRVAPHQLRHAMAVDLARSGVPIPIISRQLGHSNIATTSTYLSGISPEEVIAVMTDRAWA